MSMCNITAKGCCYLTRLPNLRAVNINAALGASGQAIRSMITGHCPDGCDGTDTFEEDDNGFSIKEEVLVGVSRAHSNITAISAQFANNGVDIRLFETLAKHAPHLKSLDLRNYLGNSSKTNRSSLKSAIRQMEKKGTAVLLSTAKSY